MDDLATVVEKALQLGSREREAYLDEVCRGNAAMRRELDERISLAAKANAFFGENATELADTRTADPAEAAEGIGAIIGRYKLLQVIGEGGFGIVYLAEQMEPVKRRVAFKVIKLGMDTREVIARFEAERQALALMDHPGIAKVLDAGATDKGRPYFVMELVKGVPITKYCDDHQLKTQERLELFITLCQAIQHAHQKGIIHRDLKPSNILVAVQDGVPVPKVIDFGIAKATQQPLTEKTLLTQFGQFIGTPVYMSPEQAEVSGLDIDTRSDIYSLGIVLYELLVGKTPLDARELMAGGFEEIRRRIREEEPVKPSTRAGTLAGAEQTTVTRHRRTNSVQLSSELRGDLDWIVLKALEKDRNRRYETATSFGNDLKRYLAHEPVTAAAPSRSYLIRKYVRRHRAALTIAAAFAVILITATLVSTSQALRATRASEAEKVQRLAAQTERDQAKQAQEAERQAHLRADSEKATAQYLLYVANMGLAQRAWEQSNLGRLRQMLEETQSSPERGFEWYYWQRMAHLESRTLGGHTELISTVGFSPDSRRLVTGSWDRTARVWEVGTGRELFALEGHTDLVNSATFSPDGLWMATSSNDQSVRIWNAANGQEVSRIEGHAAPINQAAFSPDAKRIITGGEDWKARIWDVSSHRELLALDGHSTGVLAVAFSPDGRRVITGGRDGKVTVNDSVDGRPLFSLAGHSDLVNSVGFSQDGARIVTASADELVKVWSAEDGRELLSFRADPLEVHSAAFFPNGERIVTVGEDQLVKVWDAKLGKELFSLKGHLAAINTVAISPDGLWIATGAGDWTGVALQTKLWASDGERDILRASHDLLCAAFAPDGERLLTSAGDGSTHIWDARSGKEVLTLKGHDGYILSAAYSPDGKRIVTGSSDRTAKIWDTASGKEVLTLNAHHDTVSAVAFSPDGQRVLTASFDYSAKVWDISNGKELLVLKGHSKTLWTGVFSPDGQHVATAGNDNVVKVWNAHDGREIRTLPGHSDLPDTIILHVAFSPDSKRVIMGSSDRTATVWAVDSGREELRLRGHSDQVWAVAFSPDGKRIATGSKDATVKVWDAQTGRELFTGIGHVGPVRGVAFSPDGLQVATTSWDNTARIWQAASPEQVAAWQLEEARTEDRVVALRNEAAAARQRAQVFRSQNPGAIKQWLVLAPIPFEATEIGTALEQQQVPHEAELRPFAGERFRIEGREWVWTHLNVPDSILDLNPFLGGEHVQSLAYAVSYVHSETEQTGLHMKIGCDDVARVYLNGKEVFRRVYPRSFVPDQDTVSGITLKQGTNVVVLKLANGERDWKGSVHFTEANGGPLNRVRVTLDPSGVAGER